MLQQRCNPASTPPCLRQKTTQSDALWPLHACTSGSAPMLSYSASHPVNGRTGGPVPPAHNARGSQRVSRAHLQVLIRHPCRRRPWKLQALWGVGTTHMPRRQPSCSLMCKVRHQKMVSVKKDLDIKTSMGLEQSNVQYLALPCYQPQKSAARARADTQLQGRYARHDPRGSAAPPHV